MPESLLGRLDRDADLFERAGDRKTAAGLRDLATTERAANAARRDKTALAVFLRDGVSTSQRQAIQRALSGTPGVVSVVYWSKEDALAQFKRIYAANPTLTANVTADALPASFHLRLSTTDAFDRVAALARSMPGVDKADVDLGATVSAPVNVGAAAALGAMAKCRSPAPSGSP